MGNLAELAGKPWDGYLVPELVFIPRGMIGIEERRMLYWLAAEYFSGAGTVIDLGAYLGASAIALAAGLMQSPHAASPLAKVHSYDRFVAVDDYVRNDISGWFYSVPPDYDYSRLFEFQTACCRERIVAHRGEFLTAALPDAPIEILFIDIAKTPSLNAHIVEHYFTRLIPQKSIVVQQDFCQTWYPFIPITMEFLSDYFTVVDGYVADSSRVYRLQTEIPRDKIERLVQGLGAEEETRLMRTTVERDAGRTRMVLRVAEVLQLADRQYVGEAKKALAALRRDPEFKFDTAYAADLKIIEETRHLG